MVKFTSYTKEVIYLNLHKADGFKECNPEYYDGALTCIIINGVFFQVMESLDEVKRAYFGHYIG